MIEDGVVVSKTITTKNKFEEEFANISEQPIITDIRKKNPNSFYISTTAHKNPEALMFEAMSIESKLPQFKIKKCS